LAIGHAAPEAANGGTIALVRDHDQIEINLEQRRLHLDVPEAELAVRRQAWSKPTPHYRRGVMAKYAATVSSAALGAVTG
jgi:dihydroxy-acid dehydratase